MAKIFSFPGLVVDDQQQQVDDQQQDVTNTIEHCIAALQLVVLRLVELRADKAKLFIAYDTDAEGGFINLGFDPDALLAIVEKAVADAGDSDIPDGPGEDGAA